MNLEIASLSYRGGRKENEDHIAIFREGDFLCAVLCDGLGGHEGGALASALVCSSIGKTIASREDKSDLAAIMSAAIEQAQQDLVAEQKLRHMESSMKTTLCCVMVCGDNAVAAYVGDSRIYRFRNGFLKGRTLDHSVPQYLVDTGEIRECQIRHHEDRNRLLRVMGVEWETPRYQFWDIPMLRKGDAFLLCSDGFWEWIDEKRMMFSLITHATADEWLDDMYRKVENNGRGKGMDNLSAIAIKIKSNGVMSR